MKMKPVRQRAHASGWNRFETLWNRIIRFGRADSHLPMGEAILEVFGKHPTKKLSLLTSPNSPTGVEFVAADMYDR